MAIEQKRRQAARMRTAVMIGWVALLVIFVAGAVAEAAGWDLLSGTLAVVARAALFLAIFLTVSWYVRSVSVRFDSVQQALAAIQEQLAAKQGRGDT